MNVIRFSGSRTTIRGVTVCQPSGWNWLMSRASDDIPGRFSPEYWMSAKGS
jgi:hypothetical protein